MFLTINVKTKYENMQKIINKEDIINKNNTSDGKIKEGEVKNASKADSISISYTSKNMTTAQKAKKTFDDTLNEFKDFNTPEGDISGFVR